jgi:hypothetical protein
MKSACPGVTAAGFFRGFQLTDDPFDVLVAITSTLTSWASAWSQSSHSARPAFGFGNATALATHQRPRLRTGRRAPCRSVLAQQGGTVQRLPGSGRL